MTLTELNDHRELVVALKQSNEILQSLWNAAYPGGQVTTGMPHAPGVKDKVGTLAAEIADLETDIERLEEQIETSAVEVNAFLSGISDVQTRVVFRLRFCQGMEWKSVAATLGGGNSEASVKSRAYRYLESCNAVLRRDT